MSLISTEMDSDPANPTDEKKSSTVFVRNVTGQTEEHRVDLNEGIADFKLRIGRKIGIVDAAQIKLCFGNVDLSSGSLASNGVYDGAALHLTVSMKSGPIQFGPMPGQVTEEAFKEFIGSLSSILPAEAGQPISMEYDAVNQKLILSFHRKPTDGVQDSSPTGPWQQQSPPTMDAADDESLSEQQKEQRRQMYQQIADRMRDEAKAAQQRTCEQKRTTSKLAELQARMRRRKIAQERACFLTSTMLPSGAPAPAPAPPKARPQPTSTFAGLRRGFLNLGTPASGQQRAKVTS